MAKRKRYLFVCINERPRVPATAEQKSPPKGSCATRGSVALHTALKAELAKRKLAATEVRACTSSCLDVCWAGPAIAILGEDLEGAPEAADPEGIFYGRVTLGDVAEIVDAMVEGRVVQRLVLRKEDFEQSTAGPALPELPPPPPAVVETT